MQCNVYTYPCPYPCPCPSLTLQALNLCYDITPIQFIAVVVTEVGMIPPTSVPVIIREYQN
jgi:translation initiation factor eIF-2B subunit delta